MISRVVAVVILCLVFLGAAEGEAQAQAGAIDTTYLASGVPSSTVNSMVRQADGRMVIAGSFTAIGSASRPYLARLNLDGTLDATFNASVPYGPNGAITQVALQSDGRLLVVGSFTSIGSTPLKGLARLNSDGTLDTTFNPGTGSDGTLRTVAVQADGKILTGGFFHSFNGDTTRAYLVRLNSDGSIDQNFVLGTALNSNVLEIAVQSDGRLIVAGNFTAVGSVNRRYLARLNSDGTLDSTFDPGTGLAYLSSAQMAFQSSGKLLMTGSYTGSGSATSRSGVFRLNLDGSLDVTFSAGAGPDSPVSALAVAADDSVILGGDFFSVDGLPRQCAARLLADGPVDPLFNAGTALTGAVTALALQSDGKVVVAPSGMSVTRLLAVGTSPPTAAPVLSVLVTDGTGARLSWTPSVYVEGYKIERSPDGASSWSLVATTTGERILRHYDGGLASGTTYYYRVRGFNRYGDGPNSSVTSATTLSAIWPGQVNLSMDPAMGGVVGPLGWSGVQVAPASCIVQPDGKLIAAVVFQRGSSQYTTIVRLNPDGSLDQVYDISTVSSSFYTLALQPDGKLLVGGNFYIGTSSSTHNLARFNIDGSQDTSFTGNAGGSVYSLLLQPDGKILVGGYFQAISGAAQNGIARLNTDGTLDSNFNVGSGLGSNGAVLAMALDSSGRVVVGGEFYTYNGHAAANLARLNADGSFDATFNTGSGLNSSVLALTMQPDGRILAGGSFSTYNAVTCGCIVRLNSDGSRDATFNVSANGGNLGSFKGLLLLGDGSMIVAAQATQGPGGQNVQSYTTYASVVKLTAAGAIDPTFNIGLSGIISSFCLTSDGRVIGCGTVTFANGATQAGPIGLRLTGGVAPPFPPAAPAVTASPGAQLQITWPAVSSATGYTIERSANGQNGWTAVGQSSTSSFIDAAVPQGSQNYYYYYRIRAFNTAGTSVPSGVAYGSTVPLPTSPSPLVVRAYGYAGTVLTWTEPSNTSAVIVQRSTDGIHWVQLASFSPLTTSYQDTNLSGQTAYYYRVIAENTIGDAAASSVTSATTAPPGSVLAGSLDPTFTPGVGPQGQVPYANGTGVGVILVQPDGKIVACGSFTSFGGVNRKNAVRLNPDGSVDPSFDPGNWNSIQVYGTALQSDGKVLVGGSFWGTDGYSHTNIVRLNANGSVDSTYNVPTSAFNSFYEYGFRSMCLQSDGRLLVAGDSLIRLNTDGSVDTTFSPQFYSYDFTGIFAVAVAPDGHILVSGSFAGVNNVAQSNLARLNSNGTLDTTFAPTNAASTSASGAFLVQPDGKTLVGASGYLYRYNTNGARDTTFTPPSLTGIYTTAIYALALQADGKIMVGGDYTTLGSIKRSGLMRLNTDGSIDSTFDTGVGEVVTDIVLQADGNILIAGAFSTIENQPRNSIARLLGNPVTWDAFQTWKIGNSINPTVADSGAPGSDGLPVLAEYALGGNPSVVNPSIQPVYNWTTQAATLTYTKVRSDVTYWVETSTDLVNWTSSGVNQGGSGSTVTASLPMNGAPNGFLRLRFSRP